MQITSDEAVTWNQIYEAIAAALGVRLQAVHVASEFLQACRTDNLTDGLVGDKAHSVVFDNSKLKRLVPDFVADTRFDQGIKQTVKFILEHPELQHEDKEFDQWCDKVIGALHLAANSLQE